VKPSNASGLDGRRPILLDGIDTPAERCLGGNRISQKKDEPGKGKATDQDRPITHVQTKNSTLRHCGDELWHDLTSGAPPPRCVTDGQGHGYCELNRLIDCLRGATPNHLVIARVSDRHCQNWQAPWEGRAALSRFGVTIHAPVGKLHGCSRNVHPIVC
jgi:hypothetical protein